MMVAVLPPSAVAFAVCALLVGAFLRQPQRVFQVGQRQRLLFDLRGQQFGLFFAFA